MIGTPYAVLLFMYNIVNFLCFVNPKNKKINRTVLSVLQTWISVSAWAIRTPACGPRNGGRCSTTELMHYPVVLFNIAKFPVPVNPLLLVQ